MAGIENSIVFGGGFKLSPSSSRDISDMQRTSVDVSNVNHTGTPEGSISANPSSLSHDPVSGVIYVKATGTGTTGWAALSTASSTVTSVTGTPNRITSTGGTAPQIDIDAAYVGQASITTLGTITTGVWNGTAVTVQFGGTGRATLTNHGVLVGAGTTAITQLAAGTAGQVLQSGGASADPAYSTATYPSTAGTSGKILISNGTNIVSSTPTYPNASVTAGKVIVSDGTNYIASTPTFPNASATSRKIIVSDGTNWLASTETWAVPGTSGNVLTSNGTNWTSAAPASSGIATINGDSGSATGSTVTLRAFAGGNAGATVKFAASGSTISLNLVDGNDNLMLGRVAGNSSESGTWNVGIGTGALNALTSANQNTCVGFTSGLLINSGSANTAYGYTSLAGLTTGTGNHVFGYLSGNAYTGAESSNILICNGGVNGESNVTRIGNQGTGSLQQNKCYISGITGATVTGTAVLCATDGQLGTIASSRRFKENIIDITKERTILDLRPVEFNYKTDVNKHKVFGLIAEEVQDIFPELCFYRDGEPDSVKYHEMPVLLLKEIQRLVKRIEELEKRLAA